MLIGKSLESLSSLQRSAELQHGEGVFCIHTFRWQVVADTHADADLSRQQGLEPAAAPRWEHRKPCVKDKGARIAPLGEAQTVEGPEDPWHRQLAIMVSKATNTSEKSTALPCAMETPDGSVLYRRRECAKFGHASRRHVEEACDTHLLPSSEWRHKPSPRLP